MSDYGVSSPVDDPTMAAMFAYLFGGPLSGRAPDGGTPGMTPGSPGLLRRLVESFQGEPCGTLNTLAALNAVSALTVPDAAQSCTFSVEVNNVRMTTDGTTPSASVGVLLTTGSLFTLTGKATMKAAQFFQVAAGAIIQANYYT